MTQMQQKQSLQGWFHLQILQIMLYELLSVIKQLYQILIALDGWQIWPIITIVLTREEKMPDKIRWGIKALRDGWREWNDPLLLWWGRAAFTEDVPERRHLIFIMWRDIWRNWPTGTGQGFWTVIPTSMTWRGTRPPSRSRGRRGRPELSVGWRHCRDSGGRRQHRIHWMSMGIAGIILWIWQIGTERGLSG